MRRPLKEPPQPIERNETIRRYIIALLQDYSFTAKEISGFLKVTEKDVYDHLEHIRKTMNKGDYHLVVSPAMCDKCGFTFRKRGKLSRPGKCPICHSNLITPPIFSVLKHS
jgi:hypothetical protein